MEVPNNGKIKKEEGENELRWKREFSKALAEALLEREEEEKNIVDNRKKKSNIDMEENAMRTYVELCYDEPNLDDGNKLDFHSLAKALSSSFSSIGKYDKNSNEKHQRLALSVPLIRGIVAANHSKINAEYSELAWTVFGLGPWKCLKSILSSSNSTDADVLTTSFLGSFNDSSSEETLEANHSNDENNIEQMTNEFLNKQREEGLNQKCSVSSERDIDSLQEIFADESDDDDFDYGAGDDDYVYVPWKEAENITPLSIDPLKLSQTPSTTSIVSKEEQVKLLVTLIRELSFKQLVHLSFKQWNENDISSILHDMIEILLFPSPGKYKNESVLSLIHTKYSDLYTKPLMVLYDRLQVSTCLNQSHDTNDKSTEKNNKILDKNKQEIILKDYLTLISIMLSSTTIPISRLEKTQDDSLIIEKNKAVGLSNLCNLCSNIVNAHQNPMIKKFQKLVSTFILQKMSYDIVDIMEQVRKSKSSQNNEWVQVALCLFPIFDTLTNVKSLHYDTENANNKSNLQKYLMESGWFRELLLFYTTSNPEFIEDELTTTQTTSLIQQQLLRCIWILSTLSPNTMGKYAIRVPELVKVLYSPNLTFNQSNAADACLWYLLILTISPPSSNPSTSGLRLRPVASKNKKKNNISSPKLRTTMEMQNLCIVLFEQICQGTIVILDNAFTKNNNDISFITQFLRFSNGITKFENIATTWIQTLSRVTEGMKRANQALQKVLSSLLKVSQQQSTIANVNSSTSDDDEDKEKITKEHSGSKIVLDELPNMRKGIKSIRFLLESYSLSGDGTQGESLRSKGSTMLTSTGASRLSSKMD